MPADLCVVERQRVAKRVLQLGPVKIEIAADRYPKRTNLAHGVQGFQVDTIGILIDAGA